MSVEPSIPLIDFGLFLDGSTDEREQVAQAIDAAFCSVGFLYLINYGRDADKVNECFRQSKSFFALTQSEKNSIQRPTRSVPLPRLRGRRKGKSARAHLRQRELRYREPGRVRAAQPMAV